MRLTAVASVLFLASVTSGLLGPVVPVRGADENPAEAVALRQSKFKELGKAFKAINDQANARKAEMDVVRASALDIDRLAREIETWFPEGSGPQSGVKTEALSVIWEKPEAFAAAREKLVAEAARLRDVTNEGGAAAWKEQVRNVGAACGGCHKAFRAEDD